MVSRGKALILNLAVVSCVLPGPVAIFFLKGLDIPVVRQLVAEAPVPPLEEGRVVRQTFRMPAMPISRISLFIGTYMRKNPGTVSGRVYCAGDTRGGVTQRGFTFRMAPLEDNAWKDIDIHPPLECSPGKMGIIEVSGHPETSGRSITIWSSAADAYPDGVLAVDGAPRPGDLKFKVFSRFRAGELLGLFRSRWGGFFPRRAYRVMAAVSLLSFVFLAFFASLSLSKRCL